jgi:hypothetical protein
LPGNYTFRCRRSDTVLPTSFLDLTIEAAIIDFLRICMEEFIEERAKLVRSLADKADPFIKVRLIMLAERYEHELWMRRGL